ncbi:MAG: hypothetical protein HOV78_03090 [Hamadaea sp.]|nr:hypothetical protein [Hamadaea sp.]
MSATAHDDSRFFAPLTAAPQPTYDPRDSSIIVVAGYSRTSSGDDLPADLGDGAELGF